MIFRWMISSEMSCQVVLAVLMLMNDYSQVRKTSNPHMWSVGLRLIIYLNLKKIDYG